MRIRALATVALLVVGLAGCGNDEPAVPTAQIAQGPAAAPSEGPDLSELEFEDMTGEDKVEVGARDNVYLPQYIEVSPGTEVEFKNNGRNQHDVQPANEGAFEPILSADFFPGDSGTVTFATPGEYPYYCTLHGSKTKGMTGAVRVLE